MPKDDAFSQQGLITTYSGDGTLSGNGKPFQRFLIGSERGVWGRSGRGVSRIRGENGDGVVDFLKNRPKRETTVEKGLTIR